MLQKLVKKNDDFVVTAHNFMIKSVRVSLKREDFPEDYFLHLVGSRPHLDTQAGIRAALVPIEEGWRSPEETERLANLINAFREPGEYYEYIEEVDGSVNITRLYEDGSMLSISCFLTRAYCVVIPCGETFVKDNIRETPSRFITHKEKVLAKHYGISIPTGRVGK